MTSQIGRRSVTRKRRVLDLFCKAGGAGYGYYLAGCEVTGVDIEPQPHYPFEFVQADALDFPLDGFDLIHASPPCQLHTAASARWRLTGSTYPDLIAPVRERLAASGIPYVIENVPGAPLASPVLLCGAMFGLRVYRHRWFEASFALAPPAHPAHLWPAGTEPDPARMHTVTGHFTGQAAAARAMGISWMSTRDELAQAIPPAYTEWIARNGGTRQCESCQRWWTPARSHARTCSPTCRKALSRRTLAGAS